MPVIEISHKDLKNFIGNISIENIENYSKLEISQDQEDKDKLTVEVKDSNRPDLLSIEGIARELKGIFGKEKGLAEYKINNSTFSLNAENVKARPEIVCAVIKSLKLNDFAIKQIIQLQEKLCDGFGRKRKEASIGIYDFDRIKWPIAYKSAKPDTVSFIPLEMSRALSLKQILSQHPKGRDYAHLLEKEAEYPLLMDSAKEVLSMPPVINSSYSGRITENTKNLFVEVTGFDREKIMLALNIVLSALADRNGKIYPVQIKKSEKSFKSPDFSVRTKKVSIEEINNRLGLTLSSKEMISLLEKARYSAISKKDELEVKIPFYRADVIHPVDVIEDIAIAYGYQNFSPEEPRIFTIGSLMEETKLADNIAMLLIGLGLQEILAFNMSNKNDLFKKMNLKEEKIIELENPVSQTYTCLRNRLLPSLMNVLSHNTTRTYPQRIFEIGSIVKMNAKSDVKSDTMQNLSILLTNSNFTEIKQILDYLSVNLGLNFSIKQSSHPSFIEGRCGDIIVNNKTIGVIGEINPQVLSNFNLEVAVSALEINLDSLLESLKK